MSPPREVVGTLRVLGGGAGGAATVVDERRRPLVYVDADHFLASGVMHGDKVLARRLRRSRAPAAGPAPGRPSTRPRELPPAEIVRVLERANATIVGTYQETGRESWVVPDDRRLGPRVAVRQSTLGALPGEKVVVALAHYPTAGRPEPAGPVVERLGRAGEPDAETLGIIRSLGLRDTFPADVLAEAEDLPREVTAAERRDRLDLTTETVFTIDDAEARDLDDAVSIAGGGEALFRLGVHIADVSHYVPLDSALDREARLRGTSVYLPDRVLPMFPPRLSNGIASLHPGADRLTVSVFMDIDPGGRVTRCDIHRSFIRSVARLTYDAVAALLRPEFGEVLGDREATGGAKLDGGSGPAAVTRAADEPGAGDPAKAATIPAPVARALRDMAHLAKALRRRRMARGSLDFDLPEEKVVLDGAGRPSAVVLRPRNVATQIIEEFMIAANEAIADYLLWSGVPFVSRIHEEPFRDDLEALREQLKPLGYRVPAARAPRPADLQAILEAARGRPESAAVHAAVLRALPQARYSAVRLPHFALASVNYTHFTSPIRRYPDFTVHRQVLAVLKGAAHRPDAEAEGFEARLAAVAETSSRAERLAERAEAESLELMKTELARASLGWVDEGEVVEVHDFGAFVRLPNGIEGLVAAAEGGRSLRPGERVRVQIVRVDVARRHVDLNLVPGGAGRA